jgi:ABC-type glycerol-3-phosphate transport system substrate-binding protein
VKQLCTVLCILILVFSSTTCSKEEKFDSEGRRIIHFWHAMGGPLGAVLEPMIAQFNALQDSIRVVGISMGRYTALSQKIMAAVAAGNPPEAAQAYEAWTSQLIKSNIIVPLDTFIQGEAGLDSSSLSDILPVFVQNCMVDGEIWSFPFNKSVRAMYYNKDMFERNGLDPDDPPRTWKDTYETAKQLTIDYDDDGIPDQWGTAGQISSWMFENFLLQNGGRLLSPDRRSVAYDSPAGIEALEFYYSLVGKGDVGYLTGGFEYQNDFLAGKVGFIEGSTVSLAFMKHKLSFDLGIAPLPGKERDAVIVAGTNVVVFSKSTPQRQRDAWAFIKWFTDTENTAYWAAKTGYVPVRRSAFQTDIMQKQFDAYPGLKAVFQQLEWADYEPSMPAWLEGREFLGEAIEVALRGRASPAEALSRAAEKTNNLFTRERRIE